MDLTGPEPGLRDGKPAQSSAKPTTVLEGFEQLGEQIYYAHPQSTEVDGDNLSPDLIILCSWLYALPKHISKYTAVYRKLFPTVPILLLKQDGPDMMFRPNSWQMQAFQPVISLIKDLETKKGTTLQVLIHVWSNGGSFTITQLADAFALSGDGQSTAQLPVSALIIDSAPSLPDFRSGSFALSQGLPSSLPAPLKYVGGVFLYSSMMAAASVGKLFGADGSMTGMRRKLNDPSKPFITDGTRRMYIYSDTDELVPWQHVENHAEEARQVVNRQKAGSGDTTIKMEKFVGSRHVGHVMVDPERYWKLVKSFWKESRTAQ